MFHQIIETFFSSGNKLSMKKTVLYVTLKLRIELLERFVMWIMGFKLI